MKTILITLVFLSLFCASFAAVDVYYSSKGLHITRSLDNVKVAAISTTTDAAAYSTKGNMEITVKNIGTVEKRGIVLSDGLSYIPSGTKVLFSKTPSIEGQVATWNIDTLAPSQEYKISMNVSGAISEELFKLLASPQISYSPLGATLSAPTSAKVGESVRLSLLSEGKPLANATILVLGPGNERFSLLTDSAGQAAYIAGSSGFYTYSSDDANIAIFSTEIKPATAVEAPTAGALLPKESTQPFDLLPFALGLAMLAAVAIALFTLFGSRAPDSDSAFPPTSGSTPPSAPSSPQFDRSEELAAGQGLQTRPQPLTSMPEGGNSTLPLHEEKKMQEVLSQEANAQHAKEGTKSLYEKRKLELAQKQAELLKKAQAQKKAIAREMPSAKKRSAIPPAYASGTVRGESAVEDNSIEKTIAELERIRAKLKKKGAK
ncbi:Uncharacterised protein [Candidatus Anstonella stagnisolia]|nr:Uncharacterised protein [Candidatus Anstonella stagnisolia]